MITLYQYGNSVCAQKVRFTLAEKGLEYEKREVDLFKSEQYNPEYLKLNPKGVVPTLMHDGKPVIESTLICEYLDEVFPDPPLMPENPYDRGQMRLWSKMVDEGLHDGVSEISFSAMFRQRMKEMTPEEREVRLANVGDPRRRDRFTSTYEQGVESPFVMHAIAAYEKMFKALEEKLADGRKWIFGDRYTLADINLMPYVARLAYLGLLDVWTEGFSSEVDTGSREENPSKQKTTERPNVNRWWEQVQALPSFKAGISEMIKLHEYEGMAKFGPQIRDRLAARRAEHVAQLKR